MTRTKAELDAAAASLASALAEEYAIIERLIKAAAGALAKRYSYDEEGGYTESISADIGLKIAKQHCAITARRNQTPMVVLIGYEHVPGRRGSKSRFVGHVTARGWPAVRSHISLDDIVTAAISAIKSAAQSQVRPDMLQAIADIEPAS